MILFISFFSLSVSRYYCCSNLFNVEWWINSFVCSVYIWMQYETFTAMFHWYWCLLLKHSFAPLPSSFVLAVSCYFIFNGKNVPKIDSSRGKCSAHQFSGKTYFSLHVFAFSQLDANVENVHKISIPSPFHSHFALLKFISLSNCCRRRCHCSNPHIISFMAFAIKQKCASHSPLLTSNREHWNCNMNASDEDSVCNKSNTIISRKKKHANTYTQLEEKNQHTKNI